MEENALDSGVDVLDHFETEPLLTDSFFERFDGAFEVVDTLVQFDRVEADRNQNGSEEKEEEINQLHAFQCRMGGMEPALMAISGLSYPMGLEVPSPVLSALLFAVGFAAGRFLHLWTSEVQTPMLRECSEKNGPQGDEGQCRFPAKQKGDD